MIHRFLFVIAGDALLAFFALFVAFFIRYGTVLHVHDSHTDMIKSLIFILILLFSSFFLEIYSLTFEIDKTELAVRISLAVNVAFFLLTGLFYLTDSNLYGRGILAIALISFGVLQFCWHLVYRLSLKLPGFNCNVLVLGTGPLAHQIGSLISAKNPSYCLSGYINCAAEPVMVPFHAIINSDKGLYEAVKSVGANKIVVSLSERRGVFPLQDVLTCKLTGIEVVDAPSFYEQLTGKLLLENITPSWFIFSHGFRVTPLLRALKRLVDIFCSTVGLALTLPLFPLIAIIIKLDSRGPVFFRQLRVGEGERSFLLYKFRTMREDAESKTGAVWAKEKDPRVTRIGEFLRKSRIDEIPQLYNVLRGHMSFVGPRPERPEFVQKLKEVIPYYSERHYVKPGVTGWAQVRYPYGASVEDAIEKLRYDLFYIKNISLPFDVLIILETIKVVLFRRGGR